MSIKILHFYKMLLLFLIKRLSKLCRKKLIMDLKILYNECKQILIEGKFPELAANEAALIISDILHINHNQILFVSHNVTSDEYINISNVCKKRGSGIPLQYLFNHAYFRNLELFVDYGVLIPRPETEILCQYVIDKTKKGGKVLDIGTGSGAIALSIATERIDCSVIAVEKSDTAIKIAKLNFAKYHNKCLNNEVIQVIKSDLLCNITEGEKFSAITANLPYVTDQEYTQLPFDVKNHEPIEALVAEDEGLALIKRTINEAPNYLEKDGFIVFEFGDCQTKAVYNLLKKDGRYNKIEVFKDLNNIERFIAAYR